MWQDIPAYWQDLIVFCLYLLPLLVVGTILFYRLSPLILITTLLKRYKKTNLLIVVILGVCLSVSLAIQSTATAYKTAMAKVANRFELVVTAPGSKIDMMLATVYLQPTATPLLGADIYQRIASDEKVAIAAPIAYGDSYHGHPVVGSTNTFIQHLTAGQVEGRYFNQRDEAIIGAGVPLNIGDTFTPQHGMHKNFATQYAGQPRNKALKPKVSLQEKARQETIRQKTPTQKSATAYFCPTQPQHNNLQAAWKRSSAHAGQQNILASQLIAKNTTLQQPVIGKKTPKQGNKQAHNNHQPTLVTVVGRMPVTHSPWDKAIIAPVENVWVTHGLPSGHPPDDVTALGEPFDMDYFAGTPAILVHPQKRFYAYNLSQKYTTKQSMAFVPPTVLAKLNAQLDAITEVLSQVSLFTIGLVLSLAVVAIVLLGRLFEKHFQLLQSLGSPRRFIVAIMWGYVSSLACVATILGCIGGYVLSVTLATYIESKLSVLLTVSFGWVELTLCAMFLALSSLLGLIPALTDFRQKGGL